MSTILYSPSSGTSKIPGNSRLIRASKRNPCPICKRPKFCSYSEDGAIVICTRENRGAVKATKDGVGWVHILKSDPNYHSTPRPIVQTIRIPDYFRFADLQAKARMSMTPARMAWLVNNLHLPSASLEQVHLGWHDPAPAYSFPMRDAVGRVIGIRLRSMRGDKFAVTGSHEGIFIPDGIDALRGPLVITEGASDTPAMAWAGLRVVGRPSATGGADLLEQYVRRVKPPAVIIASHLDTCPLAIGGTRRLAGRMALLVPVRVVVPPKGLKDFRDAIHDGMTADSFLQDAASAEQIRVTIGGGR